MPKVLPPGYESYAKTYGQRAAIILRQTNELAATNQELSRLPKNPLLEEIIKIGDGLIRTGKQLLELQGAPPGGLIQYIPRKG